MKPLDEFTDVQPVQKTAPAAPPAQNLSPYNPEDMSSHGAATAYGLREFGKGVADVGEGLYEFGKPPETTGGKIASALTGPLGPGAVKTAKGIYDLGKQALQVPGAIKDLYQSGDPMGHLAMAAPRAGGQAAATYATIKAPEITSIAPKTGALGRVFETGTKVAKDLPVVKAVAKIPEHWRSTSPYGRMLSETKQAVREGTAARIPVRIPRDAAPATKGTSPAPAAAPDITVLPEPRQPFAGENPGYMASVPREELNSLATTRKPGAGTQLQQLGKPILYIPNEAGYPGPRPSTLLNEFGKPIKPVSGGLGTMSPESAWPENYRSGGETPSGGGANYSAQELADFKARHGIEPIPSAGEPETEFIRRAPGAGTEESEIARSREQNKPMQERRAVERRQADRAEVEGKLDRRQAVKKNIENGSGESAASQEAINRVASEKANGIKRYRVDSRSGNRTPLIGVESVDQQAGPYEHIIEVSPEGTRILDSGSKARPLQP